MKAPPESTKTSLNARLNSHARDRWPTLTRVDIRWRTNFAYIDGRLPDRKSGSAGMPRPISDAGAQKWLREPGMLAGSAEDALDCACALYLTASFDTPTN